MIRLIFYGGSAEADGAGKPRKKGLSENSAFFHAATNVQKDYKSATSVAVIKISSAAAIIKEISSRADQSVKSLDILSHGSGVSLNFYKEDRKNIGFITSSVARFAYESYMTAKGGGKYLFDSGFRYMSDINLKKFTKDARVELHGCKSGSDLGIVDNIAEDLSESLYHAGKTEAFVIAHATKANPLILGESTKIAAQDYRHGQRHVYHNGDLILSTTKSGLISDDEVRKLLKKK